MGLAKGITGRDAQRANNFDLLRLLAAIAVLVSHSFPLSGHLEPTIGRDHLGTVAVYVFFGISGFLITQSWIRAPDLLAFTAKRLLRIYPALIVVLLVLTFVVGPLRSTRSAANYFGSGETWKYLGGNLSMWKTWLYLPGVRFASNFYGTEVNGAIWTLPHEIRAYIVVALFGVGGLFKDRRAAVIAWLAVVVVFTYQSGGLVSGHPDLIRAFAVGSCMYLWIDVVPLSWVACAVLVAGWIVLANHGVGQYLATIAVAYFAIVASHRTPASWRALTRHGDFSYGIYLWAWPVQELAISLIPHITSLETIAVALPITTALSVASWFLIERQALKLKPRPTAPLPEQAA